jgi:nicotinamidase-related amidase
MEETMKTALLLIDLQNDYFPQGKMELVGVDIAGQTAKKLLEHFRDTNQTVIHIQHISTRPTATFFLPNTTGAEIHESIKPIKDEMVVIKNAPHSFLKTSLLETLQGLNIKKLVIAGAMTHMCIDATTRAAKDLDFECTLIHDACATRDLSFNEVTVPAMQVHTAFLSALSYAYANVISTEQFLNSFL